MTFSLKKIGSILILISILVSSSIFAANYRKGDYHIGLRIPITVPVFTFAEEENPENGTFERKTITFSQMGLKNIMAGIEIDFGIFLNSQISLGGVLGYNFGYDRGDKIFSRVPLLFKINYYAYSNYRIDIPISLLLGVDYTSYRSMEHFVLQMGLELGATVYWSDNWGVVLRTGLWIYPELYADSHKNNISGFIPAAIGVTYRR